MGELRFSKRLVFSRFWLAAGFAIVQDIIRVDVVFSGVDRICDSDRIVATLSGLDVVLPHWQINKDTTTWLNASTVGVVVD